MIVELHWFPDLLDHAVFHDDDAVRHGHGLHLVVGNVDRGRSDLTVELADFGPHADAEFGVQVGERLVHKEYFGVLDDGASQGDSLALAAGKVLRFAVAVFLKTEDVDGPVHFLFDLVRRHFHILQTVADILFHRHVRVEGVVLEHHGDAAVAWRDFVDFLSIADIAKYTGFSKTTVSRYFNDPDSLTLENQQKIADALDALDYRENKVGRILASGKTEFVGIIIPNLYMHYYSEMLNQILATYEKYGYKFLVFAGNSKADVERNYIEELLAYNIEGMIVLSPTIPSEELAAYDVPVVGIEREDKYISSVNTDNYMGGVQAASLLKKSGCDILIHMNAKLPDEVPAAGRTRGFEDACRENGLRYEVIYADMGNTFEENKNGIVKLVRDLEKRYPDQKKGIFMPNDTHANVLLNVLLRKYGELPDSWQIIGFDDSPISREAVIPTSTVGQQISVIANEAMEILSARMEERKKRRPQPMEPVHRVIPPILIRRETTA
ncbi:MAG TPA: LacI family transcriptional regulator [Candidatus Mediterraneibacter merdipullorum]|nr:LacI family transcriptional regulator [Candidatus Mediterraneibacter merdipullorum]